MATCSVGFGAYEHWLFLALPFFTPSAAPEFRGGLRGGDVY